MAQIDAGAGTGSAEYFMGAPNVPTCGVEFHGPIGTLALGPQDAPYVDPSNGTTAAVAPVNKTVAGVRFAIPA